MISNMAFPFLVSKDEGSVPLCHTTVQMSFFIDFSKSGKKRTFAKFYY